MTILFALLRRPLGGDGGRGAVLGVDHCGLDPLGSWLLILGIEAISIRTLMSS